MNSSDGGMCVRMAVRGVSGPPLVLMVEKCDVRAQVYLIFVQGVPAVQVSVLTMKICKT